MFINCLHYYREVVEGNEFLDLPSEQVVQLIASDKVCVVSEEKVGNLKILITYFKCWF